MNRLLPLLLLAACANEPVEVCADEADRVHREGRIRVQTLMSPVDSSAGGALSGPAKEGKRPMRALVLLDYSGSMYGGYGQPKVPGCPSCRASMQKRNRQPYYYAQPAFRSMLATWLDAAAPPDSDISAQILLFNKSLWQMSAGKPTPVRPDTRLRFPLALSSMSAAEIESALTEIPADPFAATGRAANETHLKEAMQTAIKHLGDDGLLWIITDNIADQSGAGVSAQDAARNLAFYNALHEDPRLQVVMAYPLFDANSCTTLCGTSLFVYGVHVSSSSRANAAEVDRLVGGHIKKDAASADGLLWNTALQQVAARHAGNKRAADIVGVPLRLKPMDLDVVSVDFDRDDQGRARPIRCRRTSEFGDKVPCVATLVVKNNLRHQLLESATLTFEHDTLMPHKRGSEQRLLWAGAVCAGKIETYNSKLKKQSEFPIRNLPPQKSVRLQVVMVLPAVTIAPSGAGEVIDTAFTDTIYLSGTITARVRDVHTRLLVDPDDRREVYGAAHLPSIFRSRNETEVRVVFGASVPVQNDGKLRAMLLIGSLLLLALLLFAILLRFQRVAVTVLADGVEIDRVSLPRISSRKVIKSGQTIGRVRRGAGRAVRFIGARGYKTMKKGSAWIVTPPGGMEMRIELRRGGRRERRKSGTPGGF